MYKINLLLKIILLVLVCIVIIFTNNPFVFWLLFFVNVGFHLFIKKYYYCFLDLIILLVLFLTSYFSQLIIVYKILLFISYLIIFIITIDTKDKIFIKMLFNKNKNKSLRSKFFESNIERVHNKNKNMIIGVYGDKNINCEQKDFIDLERLYLQSRIRFNGFLNNSNSSLKIEWSKIDVMVLLLSIVFFIILLIMG